MNEKKLIASLKQIEKLVADCLTAIGEAPASSDAPSRTKVGTSLPTIPRSADFALPFRPFMNKYARAMSGPEKFAIVLAHIVKGDERIETKGDTIAQAWNGMKGTLGKFNKAFPTRAKDKAWVDSPSRGMYVLLPAWTEILRVDQQ